MDDTRCQIPERLAERFCRDPFENYFGRKRLLGARKRRKDPSSKDVDMTCMKHHI